MRKILLLFAVFTALFSVSSRAQVTFTVADGANTNPYIPIYGYYTDDYQRTQVIYPASMLTQIEGLSIQSLTFYLETIPSNNWTATFEVKIGVTNANNFTSTAYLNNPSTTVYTGTLIASNDHTLTVNFTTPYLYTGGNLLLDVSVITKGNYSSASFYGINSSNASCYGYHYDGLSNINNISLQNFIPKTTFVTNDTCTTTSVSVSNIMSSSALVSWVPNSSGAEHYYQLSYKPEGASSWTTCPGNITDNYMLLTNLTPLTSYQVRLRTFCGGSYTDLTTSFTTECLIGETATDNITIGSGTETSNGEVLPTSTYYNYSYTQQLFTTAELGSDLIIRQIDVQYFYSSSCTRNIDIYMGHTTKSAFASSSDWVPANELTLVYSGEVTFNNAGENHWFSIPLTNPFQYNGTDNLVVVFDDNTGTYANSSAKFYTHSSTANSSISIRSDGTNYSPTNPGSGSRYSRRMNMRIPTYCDPNGCEAGNVVAMDVTASSARLLFTQGMSTSSYEIQYCEEGGTYSTLTANASPFLLTGLKQNTKYHVRLRSHCASGWSDWTSCQFTTKTKDCTRLYVKTNGTGDGVSWSEAARDLNWALRTADIIKSVTGIAPEIWVADGVYYGDTLAVNGAFLMKEGINVYGGFAGNETSLSQRDIAAHPTILDGQNVRRVVYQESEFETVTVWDGFTVRNGHSSNYGGGAYLRHNATFRNSQFTGNTASYDGGGVYAYASSTRPVHFENCQFIGNATSDNGGGLYGYYATSSHCVFTHNVASDNGGGIYVYGASSSVSTISNCLVANNTAYRGGGIYSNTGSAGVENSTIVNNAATNMGGGIYSSGLRIITNSILWGNRCNGGVNNIEVSSNPVNCVFSAVEAGYPGTGNIPLLSESELGGSLHPKFVHPAATVGHTDSTANTDWHLLQGSVCVNRGSNSYVTVTPTTDLDGENRVRHNTVDLGCYESDYDATAIPQPGNIVYVTPTGAGNRDGSSWSNATDNIQTAQALASLSNADVWVAEGVYYGDTAATDAFTMLGGVDVYGGFAGDEPANYNLGNRNFSAHPTVLDGMGARRVLYQPSNFQIRTVWDGFTIQNGNHSGSDRGGGGVCLFGSSTLQNCTVTHNHSSHHGGGIYAYGTNAQDSIRIINCIVTNNTSSSSGGGIYAYSKVSILNSAISYDSAYSDAGGVYLYYSRMSNCVVSHNKARPYSSYSEGGGLYVYYGHVSNSLIANNTSGVSAGIYASYSSTINNCTVVNNENTYSANGAGITFTSSSSHAHNCIVWGNRSFGSEDNLGDDNASSLSYSAVEGGASGEGNIPLFAENNGNSVFYPYFVNPSATVGADDATEDADWRLQNGSPCVNHGSNTFATGYDLDGGARVRQGTVDMGCYESNFNSITLPQYGDIIYVTEQGSGDQSGRDWANAIPSVQNALNLAHTYGADVWVAAGTYHGDGVSQNAFTLKEGVSVYGGFAGNEPANYDLSLRDFNANATILDGQNLQRVLYQPKNFTDSTAAIVDGFTIQNGVCMGYGAGVYLQKYATLSHCIVQNNTGIYDYSNNYSQTLYGAGVYVSSERVSISSVYTHTTFITHCIIRNNMFENNPYLYGYGSGLYANFVKVTHTEISHNTLSRNGGGVYIYSSVDFSNCLIHNNSAQNGGGLYHSGSYTSNFTNCDVVNNICSNNGGGIFRYYGTPTFTNCIIWGNKQNYLVNNIIGSGNYTYCAVEGGQSGTGNLTLAAANDGADQTQYYVRFMDPANGDFQLHPTSACVNVGNNEAATDSLDFYGNPRIHQNLVDIGCSESSEESACPSVINLIVDNITTNSAHLAWNPVGSESQWLLVWGMEGAEPTTVTVNSPSYNLSGLTFNRNYTAKVRAVCGGGMSSIFSIPVNFQTTCDPTVLDTLSNFSQLSPANNETVYNQQVSFSWASMAEATSYDFYLWVDGSDAPPTPTQSGLTVAGVLNYTLPGYTRGKTYHWKVVAWNECISKTSPVITFKANPYPDLHVSAITHSAAMASQTMTVTWTVTNDGEGNTPPGTTWTDYIWLVHDADVRWYDNNNMKLATIPNLQSLNAGASYTNTATVTIPEGLIGSYYLFVFADQTDAYNINFSPAGGFAPNPYTPSVTGTPYPYLSGSAHFSGNVDELNGKDNFFYVVLNILPPPSPDLVVSSVVHGGNAISGNTANVTWTVTNQGEAAAMGSWRDAVYLSHDTILDTGEDLLVGRFLHEGPLAVGDNYLRTESFTVPVDYMGEYYFIVVTDNNNSVYEGLGEQNNRGMSAPITITLTWLTDLHVTAANLPTAVDANGDHTCTFTVTNSGSSPTYTNEWRDAVYLSSESVFNPANALKVGNVNHNGVINADSSYTVQCEVHIPDSLTGTFHWFVVVDEQNNVFEYNADDNNVYLYPQSVTIQLPDLQVSNIVVPGTINPNGNVIVRWTVRNNGPGNLVSRSFTDKFTFNGDTFYSAKVTSLSLAVGDTIMRTANIQLPCGDGSATAFAIQTDYEQQVAESNETNNTKTVSLSLTTPDLVVSDLVLPTGEAWSGTTVELSYKVTNSGTANAAYSQVTDKFYLSNSPDSYQESDLIGSYTHALNLVPQEYTTFYRTVTLTNGINGNYHYHVVCNADTAICENGSMANNVVHSPAVNVNLSPSPDLVIAQLTVPAQVYVGADFELSYTIQNQGNAALINTGVTQKFYYSTSPVHYDTNNLLSIRQDLLTLSVNGSTTQTILVHLPINATPARYYIHAITDAGDVVYEHNAENNNTKVSDGMIATIYQLDMQLVAIEGPDVVQWGQTATYRLHIVNGTEMPTLSNLWHDVLYMSDDNVLQSTDNLIRSEAHNTPLAGNGDYWVDVPVTIPFGTVPTVYLIGIADYDNSNPDINLSNNVMTKTLTVNSVPTPDLAVSEVVVLDAVTSGQSARIAYKVTNAGDLPISGATWNDKLFLSLNDTYESGDLQLVTNERSNITLAPGAFYRDTLEFTVPLPNNGNLYLLMMANAANAPYEVNRANNMAAVNVSVVLPPPGDLIVRDITCESTILSGQMLHATWNIQNIGDHDMAGNGLRTLVYISADTLFDANDRLLGSVTEAINLPIDQMTPQNATGRISGLRPGEYYLLVKTDVTNAFNEADDDNNMGHSAVPFTVTIRQLPFNTDVADTLVNDEVSDFMLLVEDNVNQTVRIRLTPADSIPGAVNMIYVTYNDMGDNQHYTYSTVGQFTASSEVYIPATMPGYYGVAVYGSNPAGNTQNVVIRADILPFELNAVDADHGGNTGEVTVELTGSRFRPGMTVTLRDGGEEIIADTLIYANYYQCFATFDLTGRTPGVYDVSALNNCEGEAVLTDGFTIEDGTPSGLSYNLVFPSSPRPNRNIVMMLEFGNTGNVDLHNQVLEITSIGGCPIALTPEGTTQGQTVLQVPLSIDGEPEGLLRPGSYGNINIYGFTSGALLFTIKPIDE